MMEIRIEMQFTRKKIYKMKRSIIIEPSLALCTNETKHFATQLERLSRWDIINNRKPGGIKRTVDHGTKTILLHFSKYVAQCFIF